MKATERHKLIDRIKTIKGLTDEERASLLALLREHKTYGLVWEDKPEAIEEKLRTVLPILEEVKDRAIISDNADAPNHILIEGDNLEALTSLSYTHEGKIDVIYIDPPYNTGNKDFFYNDKYIDKEDEYRHSKWLSFMSKRISAAKKMLSDRGVIFISIDDIEQANLKLLSDEILGSNNFVAQIIWELGRKSAGSTIAVNHEYCLVYAKHLTNILTLTQNGERFWMKKKEGLGKLYKKEKELRQRYGDDIIKIKEEYRRFISSLKKGDEGYNLKHYKEIDEIGIYFPADASAPDKPETRSHQPLIHPITQKPCKVPTSGWRYKDSTLLEMYKNGQFHFGEDEKTIPCVKRYLQETEYELFPSVIYKDGRGATKRLSDLMGKKAFDFPKDEEVIKDLLNLIPLSYDMKILDFFAGSGTTLHATMQLNAEDGGKRQCILCTNNENQICEKVTYERNKRVIQGYIKPNGEFVEGLHDNNLRYYKTAFVSRAKTPRNMQKLVDLSTDMLCIKEDVYTEKKEMGGVKTHPQVFRYFDDGKKQMLIIYREEYIEEIVRILEKMEVKKRIKTYVFSPSEDPASELFQPVEEKVELTAIPAAIYNAYKRVLPKPKDPKVGTHGSCVRDDGTTKEDENLGGLFAGEGGEE